MLCTVVCLCPVFIISACRAGAKFGKDALLCFLFRFSFDFFALQFDRLVHPDNFFNVEV